METSDVDSVKSEAGMGAELQYFRCERFIQVSSVVSGVIIVQMFLTILMRCWNGFKEAVLFSLSGES